jgi:hypothetical protein
MCAINVRAGGDASFFAALLASWLVGVGVVSLAPALGVAGKIVAGAACTKKDGRATDGGRIEEDREGAREEPRLQWVIYS